MPDEGQVRALRRKLFLGYNRSFLIAHILAFLGFMIGPFTYFSDDVAEDLAIRSEGIHGRARVIGESPTGLIPRVLVWLEVSHGGRTFQSFARIPKGDAGRIREGGSVGILFRPDKPDRVVIPSAEAPLKVVLGLPILMTALVGLLELVAWVIACSGASVFRRGKVALGSVTPGASFKGVPYGTVTITVDGEPVQASMPLPHYAAKGGAFLIAYLPDKPKKMVPLGPHLTAKE